MTGPVQVTRYLSDYRLVLATAGRVAEVLAVLEELNPDLLAVENKWQGFDIEGAWRVRVAVEDNWIRVHWFAGQALAGTVTVDGDLPAERLAEIITAVAP